MALIVCTTVDSIKNEWAEESSYGFVGRKRFYVKTFGAELSTFELCRNLVQYRAVGTWYGTF